MELISLAAQLEGILSHVEHNAEETADQLPVALLLCAQMIWIQPDVTVKEARKTWYHDLRKYAEARKSYLCAGNIQLVFIVHEILCKLLVLLSDARAGLPI